MNTDKLPGIGIAMKRAIEVFPESDHHGAVHRGDYVHGFTDAIELVKAMMRDDALDEVARIGQEIDALPPVREGGEG